MLGFHHFEYQRFIWAIGNACWLIKALAQIAFGDYMIFFVHFYGAVWANHNASPAAHAFVFVVDDLTCFFVFCHGA